MVEETAGPRDICQAVFTARFQAVSCNSSLSVFLNHYRTLRTKQRRGSKASGFQKQCHEGSTTSSNVMTPLYSVAAALAVAKAVYFFFMKHLFCVLSEIRAIIWFLAEGEVLVDPST